MANLQRDENNDTFLKSAIWASIDTFVYSQEDDVTFASYYRRFQDVYEMDSKNWNDREKVCLLLLLKLGTNERTHKVCRQHPAKEDKRIILCQGG